MDIEVSPAQESDVLALRELYRQEMDCQIIHDSWIGRALADPYLILVDGRLAGYGAVGNKYPPHTVSELYTLPEQRPAALALFRELLATTRATAIECQTNDRLLTLLLYDCAQRITSETILFADAVTTNLVCPGVVLREATPGDAADIFAHQHEPVGRWLLEREGVVVATGGALHHYNPPYADLYMEVDESYRRRGYGSYLVQELKRICYETGKIPAARCNASNLASRWTLEKAGFAVCARMLRGDLPSVEG